MGGITNHQCAFRINTNDTGAGAAALAASLDPVAGGGSAAALAAWARAEAGVYDSTSWAGTPLAAPGAGTALTVFAALPFPDGVTVFTTGNLTLYVYVRAWTGAVALAFAPVRIVAQLSSTASATTIASFATAAIASSLSNNSVASNPYSAISTISALGSVLSASSAAAAAAPAGNGTGTGSAANATAAAAAVAAQNVAIADSLSSYLASAVTAITAPAAAAAATNSSSAGGSSGNATALSGAALAAAKADTTIKVDNGLLSTIVGGASAIVGTSGTVSDATRTNLADAMAATFLGAVPANAAFLDTPSSSSANGTASSTNSTAGGATSTQSNVAPIPPAVLSSALGTLATMAASVPVSNSTGSSTVSYVNTGTSAGTGASSGGTGTNATSAASAPPPATAQDAQFAAQNTVITAIVAAMQRGCISPPCDVQAAASIPDGAADDAPGSPGRRLWDSAVAVTAAVPLKSGASSASFT